MQNPCVEAAPNASSCDGLILAAGRGQRVGGADKGLLNYRGRPLIATMVELIRPHCQRVLISCRPYHDAHYAPYADQLIHDSAPEDYAGPFAGLYAALPYLHQDCLLLPCDMPELPPAALYLLLEAAAGNCQVPAWVIDHQGQWQPLVSYLRPALIKTVSEAWERGERSLQKLLRTSGARSIRCDLPGFDNLNHLEPSAMTP
ncbi:MAG: NTP transferase domain-containing protein [Pseudomonadales bacterium]|nr:NTP transferase domain-containing protein [Pseudomonadales bacterium]